VTNSVSGVSSVSGKSSKKRWKKQEQYERFQEIYVDSNQEKSSLNIHKSACYK